MMLSYILSAIAKEAGIFASSARKDSYNMVCHIDSLLFGRKKEEILISSFHKEGFLSIGGHKR